MYKIGVVLFDDFTDVDFLCMTCWGAQPTVGQ